MNESASAPSVVELDRGLKALAQRLDESEQDTADTLEAISDSLHTVQQDLAGGGSPARHGTTGADTKSARFWRKRASVEEWDALIDWIDDMQVAYSIESSYLIPACWLAHGGVVEELAGLHRAWQSAMLTDEEAGSSGSASISAWHEQCLWPTLRRLREGHYRIASCKKSHYPETITATATDRSHQPAVAIEPSQIPNAPGREDYSDGKVQ